MRQKHYFLLSPLAMAVIFAWSAPAQAALHFDPAMLDTDSTDVADLSHFEQGGGAQPPGNYSVELFINGNSQGNRELRFSPRSAEAAANNLEVHDSTGLVACLTRKDLIAMGVNADAYPALRNAAPDQCLSPGHYIPQAYTSFDFQHMRLDISIPQVAMRSQAHGWIAPQQWDEGINAGLLNYQFSGNENRGKYGNSSSRFLNLTSGLNLGPWRLRDNSTWTDNQSPFSHQRRWQHLNTYVQRAIIPWRSELTAGDSTTDGDVFDAFSFRGLRLATDESMYPDTMHGFAPVIRGTAMSSALVTVRQNGSVIYKTAVAAGAFVINDLYPVSAGGDLEVTVTEADGRSRVFTVPYSSVPVLQRQGHYRYAFTAGRYRGSSDIYSQPGFAQATLLWGLPHSITAYGGSQVAQNYLAVAAGAGVNMGGWGALSADITQANSTLADGSRHQGQSVRFLYGRSLVSTGTTIQLAGYRYSTQGYHTLQETALRGMKGWTENNDEVDAAGRPVPRSWVSYYNLYNTRRERVELNLSQNLFNLGSLYLTGSHQTYWHSTATTNSLQAGFSSTIKHVNYTLSYGYSRVTGQSSSDSTFSLFMSVPLSALLPQSSSGNEMSASYSASRNSDGSLVHQAGISGTALSENNLNWSLSQGYSRRDGDSGELNLDYQGTYGNASAGYGYSGDYRQIRYGASGGAILHRGGLTLGQPLGTTNVLVAAPGAAGIPLENSTGIHTDWRGYTVVPYASMYRDNRVALDVSKLDDHTDIDNAVAHVVPTRGAVVRARFDAYSGARVFMTLMHLGKPLPFGTTVVVAGGNHSSLVAENGEVYLSGLPLKGLLKAQWGSSPNQQCSVHYQLPASILKKTLAEAKADCR